MMTATGQVLLCPYCGELYEDSVSFDEHLTVHEPEAGQNDNNCKSNSHTEYLHQDLALTSYEQSAALKIHENTNSLPKKSLSNKTSMRINIVSYTVEKSPILSKGEPQREINCESVNESRDEAIGIDCCKVSYSDGKSLRQAGTQSVLKPEGVVQTEANITEKPHQCGYCEERFSSLPGLRSHIVTHIKDRLQENKNDAVQGDKRECVEVPHLPSQESKTYEYPPSVHTTTHVKDNNTQRDNSLSANKNCQVYTVGKHHHCFRCAVFASLPEMKKHLNTLPKVRQIEKTRMYDKGVLSSNGQDVELNSQELTKPANPPLLNSISVNASTKSTNLTIQDDKRKQLSSCRPQQLCTERKTQSEMTNSSQGPDTTAKEPGDVPCETVTAMSGGENLRLSSRNTRSHQCVYCDKVFLTAAVLSMHMLKHTYRKNEKEVGSPSKGNGHVETEIPVGKIVQEETNVKDRNNQKPPDHTLSEVLDAVMEEDASSELWDGSSKDYSDMDDDMDSEGCQGYQSTKIQELSQLPSSVEKTHESQLQKKIHLKEGDSTGQTDVHQNETDTYPDKETDVEVWQMYTSDKTDLVGGNEIESVNQIYTSELDIKAQGEVNKTSATLRYLGSQIEQGNSLHNPEELHPSCTSPKHISIKSRLQTEMVAQMKMTGKETQSDLDPNVNHTISTDNGADMVFPNKYPFSVHSMSHVQDNVEQRDDSLAMNKHQPVCTVGKHHQCFRCVVFASSSEMKKHLKTLPKVKHTEKTTRHSQEDGSHCEQQRDSFCGSQKTAKSHTNVHASKPVAAVAVNRVSRRNTRSHLCVFCHKVFLTAAVLRVHMLNHTYRKGERELNAPSKGNRHLQTEIPLGKRVQIAVETVNEKETNAEGKTHKQPLECTVGESTAGGTSYTEMEDNPEPNEKEDKHLDSSFESNLGMEGTLVIESSVSQEFPSIKPQELRNLFSSVEKTKESQLRKRIHLEEGTSTRQTCVHQNETDTEWEIYSDKETAVQDEIKQEWELQVDEGTDTDNKEGNFGGVFSDLSSSASMHNDEVKKFQTSQRLCKESTALPCSVKNTSPFEGNADSSLRSGSNLLLHGETNMTEEREKPGTMSTSHSRTQNMESNIDSHYMCSICKRSFTLASKITQHVLAHRNKEEKTPYECSICSHKYSSTASLSNHMRSHSHVGIYKCPHCDNRFRSKSDHCAHLRIHEKERPFKCSKCRRTFVFLHQLKRHLATHTRVCPQCGIDCRTSYGLKVHLITHTGVMPYQCPICGKGFAKKTSLDRHLAHHSRQDKKRHSMSKYRPNVLLNDQGHKCPHCSRVFLSVHSLQVHCGRMHKVGKSSMSTCDSTSDRTKKSKETPEPHRNVEKPCYLDSQLSESYVLLDHPTNDTEEGSYTTSLQTQVESQKDNESRLPGLNEDRESCENDVPVLGTRRAGQRIHKCSICSSEHSSTISLMKHIRSHSRVGCYKCPHCSVRFSSYSDWWAHMRIHAKERPFKCSQCIRRFVHLHALNVHRTRIHKGGKSSMSTCDSTSNRTKKSKEPPEPHRNVKEPCYLESQLQKLFVTGRQSIPIDVLNIKEENEPNAGGKLNVVIHESSAKTYCTEKKYICYHCKEAFSHPTELYRHTLVYTCSVCPQCFCQRSFLQDHLASHTGDNHTSAASGKELGAPCEPEQNMEIHAETNPYKSSLCDTGLMSLLSLERHMNVHHKESQSYQCYICGKSFTKCVDLQKHMTKLTRKKSCVCHKCHPEKKEYECCHCHVMFMSLSTFRKHVASVKPGVPLFVCLGCGQWLVNEAEMNYHVTTDHEGLFTCSYCGKGIYNREWFWKHFSWWETTTSKDGHHCCVCGQIFALFIDFKEHITTHVLQDHSKCMTCVRGFAKVSDLQNHLEGHLDIDLIDTS